MTKYRLSEIVLNLVGFFKCSIENNIVISTGIEHAFKNDNSEVMAEAYRFDIFDTKTNTIPSGVLVIFNQVGDELFFMYRKDKFEVVSITDNLITLKKDGIDYFIERTQYPF